MKLRISEQLDTVRILLKNEPDYVCASGNSGIGFARESAN